MKGEHIKVEAIDEFYRATVTTRRWWRKDVVMVYHGQGKTIGGWSCPDEGYGLAGTALCFRINARLLEFSLGQLEDAKIELHHADEIEKIGRRMKK